MGRGYLVNCSECGYRERFFTGIGMMYPQEYQQLVTLIRRGAYGGKWKQLFESKKGMVVDAARKLYSCSGCGKLKENYNLSLYVHTEGKEPQNGYWIKGEDDDGYRFVASYMHICPECGRRMHRVTEVRQCPRCGKPLVSVGRMLWD